ncbi:MAG: M18 family aminopeptidase [SAR324 cluster bacterium]|nr:M18 family aminopeptidase [SAR324 cluster bacterium]
MIQDLLTYLDSSPTAFHAVARGVEILEKAGFTELKEKDSWGLTEAGKYYIIRGGSLAAFVWREKKPLMIAGAHTDSPGLKLKPNPEIQLGDFKTLGIEVYGGPLLHTWFDRDLGLAGRIEYVAGETQKNCLVHFTESIVSIPSLAIHLNRNANDGWKINPQTEMPVILSVGPENDQSFNDLLLSEVQKQDAAATKILDSDIFVVPTEASKLVGLHKEMINAPRLDNLLSCFAGLMAITKANGRQTNILILNDHEEVGSESFSGASGNFLQTLIRRICGDMELEQRLISESLMVSVDGGHALHPNYKDKHDTNHGPKINGGPILKSNANLRYASQPSANAKLMLLAEKAGLTLQRFVVKAGEGCGSTIGPISSALTGIETVDIGAAMLAMHSIRESCGSQDATDLSSLLTELYNQ